jgi:ankyrin repeat protein
MTDEEKKPYEEKSKAHRERSEREKAAYISMREPNSILSREQPGHSDPTSEKRIHAPNVGVSRSLTVDKPLPGPSNPIKIVKAASGEDRTQFAQEQKESQRPKPALFQAKALYSYATSVARHRDGLSFEAGQVIDVFEAKDEGWYVGEFTKDGQIKKGGFPGYFVEQIQSTTQAPTAGRADLSQRQHGQPIPALNLLNPLSQPDLASSTVDSSSLNERNAVTRMPGAQAHPRWKQLNRPPNMPPSANLASANGPLTMVPLPLSQAQQEANNVNRLKDEAAIAKAHNLRSQMSGAELRYCNRSLRTEILKQNSQISTIRELLCRGADPNLNQDPRDAFAIQLAAASGRSDVVEALLCFGADPEQRPISPGEHLAHLPALHLSVQRGHLACVKLLLVGGASQTCSGLASPLQLAAKSNTASSAEIIDCLVQHGALIKHHSWNTEAVLISAITSINSTTGCQYKADIVNALLRHGANPNRAPTSPPNRGDRGRHGYETALVAAIGRPVTFPSHRSGARWKKAIIPEENGIRQKRLEIIHLLLAYDADVNEFGGSGHPSPLIEAVLLGRRDLISLFIKRGADPNTAYSEGSYQTALQAAAFIHDLPTVETLILAGANPNAKLIHEQSKHGSILHAAIKSMHDITSEVEAKAGSEVIQYLVERGARVDELCNVAYHAAQILNNNKYKEQWLSPRELAAKVYLSKGLDRKRLFAPLGKF